jgi:hypothetical protein
LLLEEMTALVEPEEEEVEEGAVSEFAEEV